MEAPSTESNTLTSILLQVLLCIAYARSHEVRKLQAREYETRVALVWAALTCHCCGVSGLGVLRRSSMSCSNRAERKSWPGARTGVTAMMQSLHHHAHCACQQQSLCTQAWCTKISTHNMPCKCDARAGAALVSAPAARRQLAALDSARHAPSSTPPAHCKRDTV